MDSPLESALTAAIGARAVVDTAAPGHHFIVRLRDLARPHGFRVEVSKRFSWIEATLEFDSLASGLREALVVGLSNRRTDFAAAIRVMEACGVQYRELPSEHYEASGGLWSRFVSRIAIDAAESSWEASRLSALSILVPIVQILEQQAGDASQEVTTNDEFDEEGAVKYRLSKSYERSRTNRALAIALHGTTCCVCGINFDSTYGDIAKGYVEIHHLVPVSMMDSPAVVNPRTDLVPLCANCHRMAHRKWPPHTPAELRSAIKSGGTPSHVDSA